MSPAPHGDPARHRCAASAVLIVDHDVRSGADVLPVLGPPRAVVEGDLEPREEVAELRGGHVLALHDPHLGHVAEGSPHACGSLRPTCDSCVSATGTGSPTAPSPTGEDVVRVLAGTFFTDPTPTGEELALDDVLLLAPVLPSKLVCVGKNYAAHAAEFGMEVPEEPLLFLKPSTAVIGPGDAIRLLPISRRVDYEGELAVVIGRIARNVAAEEAFKVILGYTCANDVTLRDLQKTDDQWTRAKGFDGSCPLGPWIETDVDPNDVVVETRLNGETRQHASTTDLAFGVATLIEYVTSFMTLLPGDVLLTGTPEGVGALAAGDEVEVEVEGVGVLRNEVIGP